MPALELPAIRVSAKGNDCSIPPKVALVNVLTWCPSCHYEHPCLMQLAQQGRRRLVSITRMSPKALCGCRTKAIPGLLHDDRAGNLASISV